MKSLILLVCLLASAFLQVSGQPQVVTTGNNLINSSNPYDADIVIGSNANQGIRHDASIMWWSAASASRISNTNDIFNFSVWHTTVPNVSLSAVVGHGSFFQGAVGIGTTEPSSKLTIMGEGNNSEGSFLLIDNTNTSYGGNATISGIRTVGGSGAHYNFVKYQNIDGTKFLINGAGEVAIGSGITYGYKLAVNGNIRAKEIKVEAGPWPDFVFQPTYRLLPLNQLRSYLTIHRHLPGLPSATEVNADGVNLGEMNRTLLQKIEELTLYVIDLKKDNERQQKEIDQLKRRPKAKTH